MSEYRIDIILRPPTGNKCLPKNVCPLQLRRIVFNSLLMSLESLIRTALRVRVRIFCFEVQSILHSDTNYCRLRKTQQVIFHSNPWTRFGEYNHVVLTTYRVFPERKFSKMTQGNTHVPTQVYSRTVRHTHINKDTTNICSQITSDLIIYWWTIIDYFKTHCGRVKQICVFNTVKLGTFASSPYCNSTRGNVSRGITSSSTTRVFGEYFLKISFHKNS